MRFCLAASFFIISFLSSQSASAYSEHVRNACKSDYLTFCNEHELGSESLRACMRKAGPKLAKECVNALLESGEVTAAEIAKRKAELH